MSTVPVPVTSAQWIYKSVTNVRAGASSFAAPGKEYPNSRIPSCRSCRKLVEREGTGCRNSSLSPPLPFPMEPALENRALNTNEYSLKKKGKNAVQARKKLTDVYGEGVLTVRQCQNWFAKFRSGNFVVEDTPRSGRPVEADKDTIKALVNANRRITTRKIGLRLNLSNSTVYDHLKGLGLSSKLDVWVPHVLTERNLCRRIDVCDSLLKRHENDPFLKRIITGDEKGHGAKKMNRLKPFPKPIFTKKGDAVCLVGF
ncbi:histone-lysine N-methyltransferase SETMAR [Trichonephila clavipes]|nr:histone-lysine N-methyltransferase SETMAR [Trichonephila clavipes]